MSLNILRLIDEYFTDMQCSGREGNRPNKYATDDPTAESNADWIEGDGRRNERCDKDESGQTGNNV